MPQSKKNPRKTTYGGRTKTHKTAKAAARYSKSKAKKRPSRKKASRRRASY